LTHIRRRVNDQRSWLGKLVTVVVVVGLFGQVNHVERAWRNVDGCDGWRGKIRGQSGGITGDFWGHELEFDGLFWGNEFENKHNNEGHVC